MSKPQSLPTRPYSVVMHQTRSYVVTIEAASEEAAINEAADLFDCDNSSFLLRDLEIEGWEASPIDQ
ncbi:hypothetical protein GCM10007908_04050 [Rhizobium albus]|nr:hypothetical protein GCM10007908_04050 [Rhizobium albus]